jgi:hypothetical protein
MQEDCGHIVTDPNVDPLLRNTPDLDTMSDLNQSSTSIAGHSVGSNGSSSVSSISSSIRGWIRKNTKALNSEIDENMTYSQECTKVANEFDQVILEETNPANRSCTFRMEYPKCTIRLRVSFPSLYPRGATPMFEFPPAKSSLSIQDIKLLKEQLNKTAEEYCLNQNRLCMAACIQDLIEILRNMDLPDRTSGVVLDESPIATTTSTEGLKTPRSSRMDKIEKLQELFPEEPQDVVEIDRLLKQNSKSISSSSNISNISNSSSNNTNSSGSNSSSSSTIKKRKSVSIKTDDRRVPSPATAFGCFTRTGQFIFVNSFSMRDFTSSTAATTSSPENSTNDESETTATIKSTPKGLPMKTYEEWKRRMFARRRGRATSEILIDSPSANDRSARSSVNSQDYFQNFFSGYSSRDLRTPSPLPDSEDNHDDASKRDELDSLVGSSPINDPLQQTPPTQIPLSLSTINANAALLQQQQLQQQAIKSRLHHQLQEQVISQKPTLATPSLQRKGSIRAKKLDLRVHVYDVIELGASPISLPLAKEYSVFGNNIRQICDSCKQACLNDNKSEIAKIWEIIAEIADETLCADTSHYALWNCHPLGKEFVSTVFDHYLKQRDVQTLALLSCVLAIPDRILQSRNHTTESSFSLLDASKEHLYNHFRIFYSEILHRWGLNCQRNEIMKFITSEPIVQLEQLSHDCAIEIIREVEDGQTVTTNNYSISIYDDHDESENTEQDEENLKSHIQQRQLFFKCSLCRLPVKGLHMMCSSCGHGGHIEHLQSWFSNNTCCASGCGCSCVEYMDIYPLSVASVRGGATSNFETSPVVPDPGSTIPKASKPISSSTNIIKRLSTRSSQDIYSDAVKQLSLAMSGDLIPSDELMDSTPLRRKSMTFANGGKQQTQSNTTSQNHQPVATPVRTPNKFKFRLYDYNQDWY